MRERLNYFLAENINVWYKYSKNNVIDTFLSNKDKYLDEAESYIETVRAEPNRGAGAQKRIEHMIKVFENNIKAMEKVQDLRSDDLRPGLEALQANLAEIIQIIADDGLAAPTPAGALPTSTVNYESRPAAKLNDTPVAPTPQPANDEDKIRASLTVRRGNQRNQVIVDNSLYSMPMTIMVQVPPVGEIQNNIQEEAKTQYLNQKKSLLLNLMKQAPATQ